MKKALCYCLLQMAAAESLYVVYLVETTGQDYRMVPSGITWIWNSPGSSSRR